MPEKRTIKRARQDKREGKSASTQAGEFVHEEIEHIREGKHGARSAKQAIAIGLSKARRAGVDLPPPKKGEASEETRRKARKDAEAGAGRSRKTTAKKATAKKTAAKKTAAKKPSVKKATRAAKKTASKRVVSKRTATSCTRSRATTRALKREGRAAASSQALSRQAKKAASKRSASDRSKAAKKAVRTKGAGGRSQAAKKAARTRARHEGRQRHNGATAHA